MMPFAPEPDMVASSVLNFDLDAYASAHRRLIEQTLDDYLSARQPHELWESMRYSVLSGGKRIRALLCIASAQAAEHMASPKMKAVDVALPCACAVEMVHAMSLIHDDLPCMDNDDFRRGKPTNHKVYGEAMALLAGDALLVLANEILLRKTPAAVDRALLIDVAAQLSNCTGPEGMVGGQVADLIATGSPMVPAGESPLQDADKAQLLESIHKRKTGALLRFSTWSGARLMGAEEKIVNALGEFGDILGLAFQIADDLLDMTGDLKTLGKTPGKDEAAGKLTWVSVFGAEQSRRTLAELEVRGKSLLQSPTTGLNEESTAPLAALLSYAVHRSS
jgi:geranylgeranyl diphosphate synthase type II